MEVKLNKTQRQSLAKFFYDMAKLLFGAVVLTKIWDGGSPLAFALGLLLTIFYTVVAVTLEKENGDDE
ncbi:MAG: hypothetical protein HZA04_02930 [Nitrospinae bacterium]|nr:hypothetical protein [Nitrospinota bacterium]